MQVSLLLTLKFTKSLSIWPIATLLPMQATFVSDASPHMFCLPFCLLQKWQLMFISQNLFLSPLMVTKIIWLPSLITFRRERSITQEDYGVTSEDYVKIGNL